MDQKIRCGSAFAALIGSLSFAVGNGSFAAGDPKRGAQVFQACVACHLVKPGEHLTGPSLAHVWNYRAGTAEKFSRYSDALKRADIVWDEATLDKWLSDPAQLVPGTSMTFPGVKESKDRQDVIAYLRAVSEGKAPSAEPRRGGMMMQSRKADLKKAPPAGQVVSIGHCGDTYTVKTADGKTNKVWEFNLRFKTDSSKDGPRPGKPVIVGAGMQGDRASVVFAAPAEIGSFIKQTCQ
jgi:cytochrome c